MIVFSNILLIIFSWYPFSFDTCFIQAFSLLKSSLLVIMENALLNKEETPLFPYSLFNVWDLQYRYCSVCVGFLYTNTEIFPLFGFNKVSRNTTSPLPSSSKVNLMFWWRLLIWMKKFSKCVRLRMEKTSSIIVSKIIEGVGSQISQFAHELANELFLWLKMLVAPLQRQQFVGKT